MKRTLLKKSDLILLLCVLLLAGALLLWRWLRPVQRLTAVITVNGVVVDTVDLSTLNAPRTITPATEPPVVIVADSASIRFAQAGCRDQLCVACGRLTRPGDTAVCLPAKTVVTLQGGALDAITY